MASTYLTRTFGTPTNEYKWTFSAWVKRSGLGAGQIFAPRVDGNNTGVIGFNSSNALDIYDYRNAYNMRYITNRLFRDTSAWYHIVVSSDSTLSTPLTNIYINGVQETSFSTSNAFTQNQANTFNRANVPHYVGQAGNGSEYFDGLMSHIHWIDGTAYDASAFGETDATTGIWKPKTAPSVTYGNNGFFLKFENSGAFGTDSSGNANTFTVNGTMTQTIDTPSNVFAVLNPLDLRTGSSAGTVVNAEFSDGNLTALTNSIDTRAAVVNSTIAVNVGKWYMEFKAVSQNLDLTDIGIISKDNWDNSSFPFATQDVGYAYRNTGDLRSFSGTVSYGNSYTTNDIIGIALDLDNGVMWFSKNGTWQNSATISEIENGTTTNAAFTGLTSNINFVFTMSSGGDTNKYSANFGNGYFGTTAVSSAQNPDDGIGIFEYDVPAGYYALNTKSINAQEYD
jgi:hypothetical protein